MQARRALFTLIACAAALPAAAQPLYSIKDLTPSGYTSSVAYDINSDGDVIGIATRFSPSFEEVYFFYDHTTGISTPLGSGVVIPRDSQFTGSGFRRAAINDSDLFVGVAAFVGGAPQQRGFRYASGTFTSLGTLFLGAGTGSNIRPSSDAMDINASGLVTGNASSGVATSDNVDIYTATAAPVTDIDGDLTVLTARDTAYAINDAGLIAGRNQDAVATLFSGVTETTFLTGTSLAATPTLAIDLNDSSKVIGNATTLNSAFIYDTSTSTLTILPNLLSGSRVTAKGLNESGDVVGEADRSSGLSGESRGFVYTSGAMYALEDHTVYIGSDTVGLSDWERLLTAWAINDDGMIVGRGDRRFDGASFPNPRAYLLTPFPDAGCNPADLNIATAASPAFTGWGSPDGAITPTDFTAFATFFGTGDLRADINDAGAPSPAFPSFGVPDGLLTPTDFSAFALYFGAGCPCTLPGCP